MKLVTAPDESVWLSHLGALVRIDPRDGAITVVGRPVLSAEATEGFDSLKPDESKSLKRLGMLKADGAPAGVGRMTFSGKDLFLGGTPSLRRIRGLID